MSLDHIAFHQGSAPDFPLTWTRETDAAEIFWLSIGEHASRRYAQLTASFEGGGDPDQEPSVWFRRAAAALESAAPSLVRSLRYANFSARPVIVVRGFPISPIPPATPYDGVVDLAASHQAIVNLHAVVACLDLHPIAYARENSSILHAVCPVTRARGQVSSRGFDAALPFHTDYADRPIDEAVLDQSPAATALAFAVERAEPETPMQFVAVSRLLAALSPEQIRTGCEAAFDVMAPDSFGGGPSARLRRLFLPDDEGSFRCRLNLGKMRGRTARAARLLHELREILCDETLVRKIHVRRGDIVIMDNQRAIHRRAAFAPRWDGTDRYFIRMSAAPNPRSGLAVDPARPWVWS